MNATTRGRVLGTGAAITLSMGYVPAAAIFTNASNSAFALWTDDMDDASMLMHLHSSSTGLVQKGNLRIGTVSKAKVKMSAIKTYVNGVAYFPAAAELTLTATTVPDGKFGAFGWQVGSNGTVDACDATDNATGYATADLALADLAAASAGHALIGWIVVEADGADFVGATTLLDATTVTVSYYDAPTINEVSTNGITPLDGTTGTYGLQIGADATLNVPNQYIYYIAFRD